MGDYDQGLNILSKSIELDPLGENIIDILVWANFAAGNFEECLEFKPLSKYFTPCTWLLRIACLGALFKDQERNEELKAFVDLRSIDEMNKQLIDLQFNNTGIENNIRSFVNGDAAFQAEIDSNKVEVVTLS